MRTALLFLCSFLIAASASAMGKSTPSAQTASPSPSISPSPSSFPSPTASPSAEDVVEVTPDTLRQYVLYGNSSIMQELTNVYMAKDERLSSIGKLLPGLNLGAVFGSTSSGPTFLISSISFLLPFLIPDNWINVAESEHTLNAEESSYLVLELNQYASAYSLYETVVNDLEALTVLQQNYDTLYQLYLTLRGENQITGTVNPSDVENAQEKAELAKGPLIDMQRVIDVDVAALRQAMGLGLDKVLKFSQKVHVEPSSAEGQDVRTIATQALKNAPENAQLSELLAAAKDAKLGAIFGFITGSTLGSTASTSGSSPSSASLSNLIQQNTVSLGFSYAPTIQLTNDNIDAVKNQQTSLGLQINNIVETTLKSIAAVNAEMQTSYSPAEDHAFESYLSKYHSYSIGTDTLLDVLQAESDYFSAAAQRVQAQAALDLARITLHRTLLTDQFSSDKIQGCAKNVKAEASDSGFFGWLKDLFHPSSDRVTLDQMCRSAAPENAAAPL